MDLQAIPKFDASANADEMIIKLGDLENFQISISRAWAEMAEKETAALIRSKKINFPPGKEFRDMLNPVKYDT